MNLKTKFLCYFLSVSIIPVAILAIMSFILSSNALMESAQNQLNSVRAIKKIQIEEYFERKLAIVENLSSTEGLQTALKKFSYDSSPLKNKMAKYDKEFTNQLTEHFNYERAGYYDFFSQALSKIAEELQNQAGIFKL